MRTFISACCVFILFFLLPAALPADGAETSLLEGMIETTDGLPARDARITVWDGRKSSTAVADSGGKFTVRGVPPGCAFALRLSPKDFSSVRIDGFRFPEQGSLSIGMEYGVVRRGAYHTSRIPSNPTTGYSWVLLEPGNTNVMRFHENSTEQSQDNSARGLAGRGGRETWTFEAVGKGSSAVVLGYRRPWERGVSPLRYHVLLFEVR